MGKKSKRVQLLKTYDTKLQELQTEKMHYQMTGQYLNAQKTLEKIEKLRSNVTELSTLKLRSKQNKQKNSMKKQQNEIMNKFESDWKKRMKLFQSNCYDKSIGDLSIAQKKELSEFNDELQYKLNSKNIKWTPEILSARDKELALARLNKFDAAYDMQQHRLKLEEKAFADYQKEMNAKYRLLIQQKQSEHSKQMSSLTERLDNSRDELERAYNTQKDQLQKRQRTIMKNFDFSQKKVNSEVSTQNNKRILKTYVGTYHGHNGTVSSLRPWTFRVNETNLSPKKAGSKEVAPIPNEDIAEIEQYIVSEYKKENKSPPDGKTNLYGKLVNIATIKSKKGRKQKKGMSLSAGVSLLDQGNRLTNLISEINNMKLFKSPDSAKPLMERLTENENVDSVDLEDIDIDEDDVVDQVESAEDQYEVMESDESKLDQYRELKERVSQNLERAGILNGDEYKRTPMTSKVEKELLVALKADCSD